MENYYIYSIFCQGGFRFKESKAVVSPMSRVVRQKKYNLCVLSVSV